MKQQLQTMLALQDEINTLVNDNWREQNFAWYRAIWVESAELLDHYGWKWWKKQVPDMDQVKLELVDIWHFGLSLELQSGCPEEVAASMCQALKMRVCQPSDFRTDLETFTLNTLADKRFDLVGFVQLLADVNMSFDELYQRYVGKNVLNRFRQDNGYKTGTYVKNWGGREDNEHLAEISRQLDTSSPDYSDQVYRALEARYREITLR
ncbi:dUTP diphosphatase [Microbulbifer thermotolerans]|uniref:dUTP diphosphatase n=1 Tax=Microbulbifer thermotolerans TaxID=252514 RepID=UPI0022498A17|nr:dUTP diphosphatase [Microbulbifer thermotolerans]MCX2779358.1 dUTP diphosphatase [Microbulbifer thermotolerans]MCX2805740.1 dUTP diphosphatase [Microbulbifer thermotolerans]MCX2831215.1 dUTP diphosphatase [Microbulbifer thermotolerans]